MNLSNIIVQGGLQQRAAEDYQDQQSARSYAAKARDVGVRKLDAEDQTLDKNTDLTKLRQQVEQNELEFKKTQQPVQQATEAANAGVAKTAAETNLKLAPGAATLASGAQQQQIQDLSEKQTANLWNMVKMGDMKGATDLLSNSEILFPGRKFNNIVRGRVPVPGPDGKPTMGADGQPVMEPVVQLVPADGAQPVFIPEKALDTLVTKHSTRVEKAGNNLVRLGADGKATPIYEPDAYGNTGEGDIYSKRTGQAPPAAGGVAGGPKPLSRQADAHLNENVKMAIDKVLLPKYGGKFEGGMFFPDDANKDVALRASVLTEQFIRNDRMDPVAAANKGVEQAEREKATAPKPGSGTYSGPTPWKR